MSYEGIMTAIIREVFLFPCINIRTVQDEVKNAVKKRTQTERPRVVFIVLKQLPLTQ